MTEKQVIVNADDFGFSPAVSAGILRAHREGIVTSTTIMANMPAAEDAAAVLATAPGLGVGVHLNVSQGPPLSKAGLELAGKDGLMCRTAAGFIAVCIRRPALLEAVEAECEAQLCWAMDHGIAVTHLDSHRHAHAFTPVFRRVAALARRYHIPFVRWHGEKLPGPDWSPARMRQRCISLALNYFARRNSGIAPDLRATVGTWGIAHTGRIDTTWLLKASAEIGPGATEIMTHPGLADGEATAQTHLHVSRAVELQALCDPSVREAFERHGVGFIHYGQLRLLRQKKGLD